MTIKGGCVGWIILKYTQLRHVSYQSTQPNYGPRKGKNVGLICVYKIESGWECQVIIVNWQ